MDPKKLMIALLKTVWPGGSESPSSDKMMPSPDDNIDILAEASTTAALVAASQGALDLPIASIKITVI